jgi:hypothetical protein
MLDYSASHYLPKKNDKNVVTLYYVYCKEFKKWLYLSNCGGGWFVSKIKNTDELIKL